MKKILVVLLAGVLVFSFAACSKSSSQKETETTTEAVIMDVTVKISNSSKEKDELTDEEKKIGFTSKSVDVDNSTATYTISETKMNSYLKKLAKAVTNCRKELINDKKIKGILTVSCTEHYSQATVTVDTSQFKTKNADTVKSTYLAAMKEYQKWSGNDESECSVKIIDENGKTVA